MPRAVLSNPCRRCGEREADIDGMCPGCDVTRELEGPLPAWVPEWWRIHGREVDAKHAAWKQAHSTPLTPARNFGELFTDFELLVGQPGVDVYERHGHGPLLYPSGAGVAIPVSRYCSLNIHGRRGALVVLPDTDLLRRVVADPLLMSMEAGEGLTWAIVTDPLEGVHAPNARVYYFYRRVVAQRLVAVIKASTVPL